MTGLVFSVEERLNAGHCHTRNSLGRLGSVIRETLEALCPNIVVLGRAVENPDNTLCISVSWIGLSMRRDLLVSRPASRGRERVSAPSLAAL